MQIPPLTCLFRGLGDSRRANGNRKEAVAAFGKHSATHWFIDYQPRAGAGKREARWSLPLVARKRL